mmetsp:Transcript_19909/g.37479  ORF Transcript_19909/g.37479 Transcript_19909/m.37479 type:complete len:287 (+) Transcript_19909:199-1059(+)
MHDAPLSVIIFQFNISNYATMMKLTILSATVAATAAFAPTNTLPVTKSALFSTPTEEEVASAEFASSEIPADIPQPVAVKPINGWVPDESLPCYGLPGAIAPTGYFDPLGFAQTGITLNEIKRNREAEVMHGRVAMIACLGYFAGEQLPSPFGITGPANDQLQQMPAIPFVMLSSTIAAVEIRRASIGWQEPDFGNWSKTLWKLRDNYYPGDVGFDPLGLKPTNAKDFANMQTKELQNGRLAMIGWAGMCSQELVNHRTIMETIEFYQKVFGGVNPYDGCADGVIC